MRFADIFSDGMVLQRRKPISIWGEDFAGTRVTVELNGVVCETAVCDGKWKVIIPPQEAGWGFTLTAGNDLGETLLVSDVAVGEVWVAGGQSNMEFLMKHDAERDAVLPEVLNEQLRFYECPKISYEGQLSDEDHSDEGVWRKAVPGDSAYFSAVGFYFAQKLHQYIKDVPVGIIGCNWGGTSASCWMTDEYLQDELRVYVELREKTVEMDLPKEFEAYKKLREVQRTPEARKNGDLFLATPQLEPMKMQLSEEQIAEFAAIMKTKYAPFSPFCAAGLYQTMLRKIIPYSVAGVLWYQGEEDASFPHLYENLLCNMIRCWRDAWDEDLPFVIAQLTAFVNPGEFMKLDFTPIRRAQELVCKNIPGAYLVCTMDAGLPYDIHPKHKRPVGERMAMQALNYVYGYKIISEFPCVCGVSKEDGKVTLTFLHCGEHLVLTENNIEGMELYVNGKLTQFTAYADDDQVTVCASEIKKDSRIRILYQQKDYCKTSLFSSVHLPALPFVAEL